MSVQLAWVGRSGRVWDLSFGATLWMTDGTLRGLGNPEIQRHRRPRVGHGSRDTGWRVSERPIEWNIFAEAGDEMALLTQDREFWSDLHPGFPGSWSATMPDGTLRTLRCFLSGEASQNDMDPLTQGWSKTTVLMDGDPFWTAEPITRQWGTAGYQGPWLIPAGAPDVGVMRFAAGQTFGSASVTNPGDVDAWPTWTITGSASSWSVGVGSQVITSSAPLLAGEQRIVRTDGGGVYVTTAGGSNRFSELGAARAAAIPAGKSVSLNVNLVGSGSVAVSFQPRHLRAY